MLTVKLVFPDQYQVGLDFEYIKLWIEAKDSMCKIFLSGSEPV